MYKKQRDMIGFCGCCEGEYRRIWTKVGGIYFKKRLERILRRRVGRYSMIGVYVVMGRL